VRVRVAQFLVEEAKVGVEFFEAGIVVGDDLREECVQAGERLHAVAEVSFGLFVGLLVASDGLVDDRVEECVVRLGLLALVLEEHGGELFDFDFEDDVQGVDGGSQIV
jgi:hypothetical protein